ncbi:hypothetical protein BH18ACT5_BH18ACT5_12920 [soil metagenome]
MPRRLIAPAVFALIGLVGAVWLFADPPQQSDPALGVAALVFVAVGVDVLAKAGSGSYRLWLSRF